MDQSQIQAVRAIVKPRSVIITTRYFWQKWRPLLGNSLAILIIEARRKCYRNLETGEVRDWFYSTIGDLAESAGFSPKKAQRLLKLPLASKFIRYKPTYIYDSTTGKKVKSKCLFRVTLDDPLVPDDKARLICQDIHKSASFHAQPKAHFDQQLVSFKKPSSGQIDLNSYSTIRDININLNNIAVTNSRKGGTIQAEQGNLAMRRKKYTAPERYDSIYCYILNALGNDSILIRTILATCFIAKVENHDGGLIATIDAPNLYYGQVLKVRIREKILALLEKITGQKVALEIVNSSQS